MFAPLIAFIQATSFASPYPVRDLAFSNGGKGLLLVTEGSAAERNEHLNRFYYVPLDTLKPRLITTGVNQVVSHDGKLLALEGRAHEVIDVFRISDGQKLCSTIGDGVGTFSPDGTLFGYRVGDKTIKCLRISDGQARELSKWKSSLSRFAPQGGHIYSHDILDWDKSGMWVTTCFMTDQVHAKYVGTYIDPAQDRIVGRAPDMDQNWLTRFSLNDGSRILDELQDKSESMMDMNRIVRIRNGKRKVLWDCADSLSAGHEMSADWTLRGKHIYLWGATEEEGNRGTSIAKVYSIDIDSARHILIASGRYVMPKGMDGNTMYIDFSPDGSRMAYADFAGSQRVFIRRLGVRNASPAVD